MTIEGIKEWLDEGICFFEGSDRDTTPERIKVNRELCGKAFRKREEIKTWVKVNKPAALPYLVKLKEWWEDWNHYFNKGYVPVSGETIDTLADKILERLKFIREKIEEL